MKKILIVPIVIFCLISSSAGYAVSPPSSKVTVVGAEGQRLTVSQAVWISSNPPLYAALLVTPFKKGGKFKVELPLSKTIGDKDCTKVKCAVLTRADHTKGDNRTADVIVPITFSK